MKTRKRLESIFKADTYRR